MPKFIVELWIDGYESEEEMNDACLQFIKEQLDFTASSVTITPIDEKPNSGICNVCFNTGDVTGTGLSGSETIPCPFCNPPGN